VYTALVYSSKYLPDLVYKVGVPADFLSTVVRKFNPSVKTFGSLYESLILNGEAFEQHVLAKATDAVGFIGTHGKAKLTFTTYQEFIAFPSIYAADHQLHRSLLDRNVERCSYARLFAFGTSNDFPKAPQSARTIYEDAYSPHELNSYVCK